jgi:phage terminase large subunit-like protein
MIESETQEGVSLTNNVTIEVATASFRSVRGFTLVAALLDELAFWQSEDSANPDTEVLAAIRPGMATIPNAMLLAASSPYARRGACIRPTRNITARTVTRSSCSRPTPRPSTPLSISR